MGSRNEKKYIFNFVLSFRRVTYSPLCLLETQMADKIAPNFTIAKLQIFQFPTSPKKGT